MVVSNFSRWRLCQSLVVQVSSLGEANEGGTSCAVGDSPAEQALTPTEPISGEEVGHTELTVEHSQLEQQRQLKKEEIEIESAEKKQQENGELQQRETACAGQVGEKELGCVEHISTQLQEETACAGQRAGYVSHTQEAGLVQSTPQEVAHVLDQVCSHDNDNPPTPDSNSNPDPDPGNPYLKRNPKPTISNRSCDAAVSPK